MTLSVSSKFLIPDHSDVDKAIARTTHMAIAAHQDDLEIMSYHGILACYRNPEKSYFGIVVTDGAGSARSGKYAAFSDSDMKELRAKEQEEAAKLGEYGVLLQMGIPSENAKDPGNENLTRELAHWIQLAKPEILYTHNPADKHTTHVALVARVLQAIRLLPMDDRPKKLYGCEVWGDLDWLPDSKKVCLDVGGEPELAKRLIEVFASQIEGGKRYGLATLGRRMANATYHQSHAVDQSVALTYAMDLTPLIQDDSLSLHSYVSDHVDLFHREVMMRLAAWQR